MLALTLTGGLGPARIEIDLARRHVVHHERVHTEGQVVARGVDQQVQVEPTLVDDAGLIDAVVDVRQRVGDVRRGEGLRPGLGDREGVADLVARFVHAVALRAQRAITAGGDPPRQHLGAHRRGEGDDEGGHPDAIRAADGEGLDVGVIVRVVLDLGNLHGPSRQRPEERHRADGGDAQHGGGGPSVVHRHRRLYLGSTCHAKR